MDSYVAPFIALVSSILIFVAGRQTSRANANAVDIKTFHELRDKVNALSETLIKVREDLLLVKSSNRALWEYVYELIDFIKKRGHIPPPPPVDLDTNPKLIKLLNNE